MSNTFKMMQFSFPLNIDLILQERQPCYEMLYSLIIKLEMRELMA